VPGVRVSRRTFSEWAAGARAFPARPPLDPAAPRPKVARVWVYRDGALLPDAFEARGATAEAALLPALVAAAEACGLEVCMDLRDADPDEARPAVETWHDVTETHGGRG